MSFNKIDNFGKIKDVVEKLACKYTFNRIIYSELDQTKNLPERILFRKWLEKIEKSLSY